MGRWLELIDNVTQPPPLVAYEAFLAACLQGPARGRYIRYDATSQQKLLPNIVTLAGVLDAVPLEFSSASAPPPHATVLTFDALAAFDGFAPVEATRYVYEHHVNMTTGLSWMNPGYESQ